MTVHKTCDGVKRRDFLRVGTAGLAGVNLASYLSMAQAGELAQAQAKNAIFVPPPVNKQPLALRRYVTNESRRMPPPLGWNGTSTVYFRRNPRNSIAVSCITWRVN